VHVSKRPEAAEESLGVKKYNEAFYQSRQRGFCGTNAPRAVICCLGLFGTWVGGPGSQPQPTPITGQDPWSSILQPGPENDQQQILPTIPPTAPTPPAPPQTVIPPPPQQPIYPTIPPTVPGRGPTRLPVPTVGVTVYPAVSHYPISNPAGVNESITYSSSGKHVISHRLDVDGVSQPNLEACMAFRLSRWIYYSGWTNAILYID
jgi:hypothetical protein